MRKSVSPQMFLLGLQQQQQQPPRAASRLKHQQWTARPLVVQVLHLQLNTDMNLLKAADQHETSLNQSVSCLQQSRQSSAPAKTPLLVSAASWPTAA